MQYVLALARKKFFFEQIKVTVDKALQDTLTDVKLLTM